MKPVLSIIVPMRNQNATLPRLLDSIAAQKTPVETIVVDDCSHESSEHLALSFQGPKVDIRYIRLPERVFTKDARLIGLEAARADIVTFADADDVFYGADALGAAVELFHRHEPDLLHCATMNMASPPVHELVFLAPVAEELVDWEILRAFTAPFFRFNIWGKLYRRYLWQRLVPEARRFPVWRFSEDMYLFFLYALHARRYRGAPLPVYGYYRDSEKAVPRALGRMLAVDAIRRGFIPYMRECACPEDIVTVMEQNLARHTALHATRWLRDFRLSHESKKNGTEVSFFSEALARIPARDLLRILCASNALLARELTGMIRPVSRLVSG